MRAPRWFSVLRPVPVLFALTACAGGELITVDAGRTPDADSDTGGRPDTGSPDVVPDTPADIGDDTDATEDTDTADDATDVDVADADTATDVPPDTTDAADIAPDLPPGAVPCTPAQAAVTCGDATLCVDGYCCDTSCVGACNACNLPGLEGTCSVRPATEVCREPTGPCDAPELCDGVNIGCGTDRLQPSGVECRPAANDCDQPEFCSGFVNACPPDTFVGSGTACGDASDTECDNPDTCDGAGTCQPNPEPPTTVCTEATSACEAAATCDGNGACAGGGLLPVGTPCGSAATTECDAPDACNEAGQCVPNFRPVGTACGDRSDTVCDNPDRCDGAGTCHPNPEVAGAPCGDPTSNACTAADSCDGAGVCAANHRPAGTACGDTASSICDRADSCDGGGVCSSNPEPSTVVCRAPAHACDLAERCNGAGSCPADALASVGTPCGDASGSTCSAPDTCSASGECLPNHAADGLSCGVGDAEYRCGGGTGCDLRPQARSVTRTCSTGACVATGFSEWGDLAVCAPNAICSASPSSATCVTCATPPSGYCDGNTAYNFTAAGACVDGGCQYPVVTDVCAGSCSVVGSTATCSSCNDAIMSIPNAPLWTWDGSDQGWNMGDDWGRTTGSRRNGTHGLDTNPFDIEYPDSANERNQWTSSYDLTRCSGCTVSVGFWLRGNAESCCDGIFVECSGNGGSNWTAAGSRISGSYSGWTWVTRSLPSSCITNNSRVSLRFASDSSVVYSGYYVDDLRVFTTATAPTGFLDTATASAVSGWTCDGDAWSTELTVRLRFFRNGTGTSIDRYVRASTVRGDLVTAGVCGGTGNHGYEFAYDVELLAALGTGTHTVRAYAIDGPGPCGAGEYELSGSPKTFVR